MHKKHYNSVFEQIYLYLITEMRFDEWSPTQIVFKFTFTQRQLQINLWLLYNENSNHFRTIYLIWGLYHNNPTWSTILPYFKYSYILVFHIIVPLYLSQWWLQIFLNWGLIPYHFTLSKRLFQILQNSSYDLPWKFTPLYLFARTAPKTEVFF